MAATSRPAQRRRPGHDAADGALTSSMLIFDLEAVDSMEEDKPCTRDCELARTLQILAAPQTYFEAQLLADVRSFKAQLVEEEGCADIVVLATRLAAVGYKVAVRTAVGGGAGQQCFHNLRYDFLLVADEASGLELTVDPRFREQFFIAQSTEEYTALVLQAPEEYVGSSARLRPMVKLLCAQMQEAFQAKGVTFPPWRRGDSMLSKWVPVKAKDMEIASPSSSPEAYSRKALVGLSPRGPLSRSNSAATTASTVSSSRTLGSNSNTTPVIAAQPLMRQAGFNLACVGRNPWKSSGSSGAQTDVKRGHSRSQHSCQTAKDCSLACSNNSPGSIAKVMRHPARVVQPPDNVGFGWQAPRIRTVKMAGDRRL